MPVCVSCGQENPEGFRLCGMCGASLVAFAPERRKLATLLFCDVSGSTAMGERLDAESVRELMFRYFHEMRDAIERHGGTVEKFVGDAVLAVFGVPVAHEDDALRAVRAASDMRGRLDELNEDLERRFGARLTLRIGINTGEVVAGDASTRETFVTGDAVNTAARLEQAAAAGEILLGELTHRLANTGLEAEPVEPIPAKGKAEPVPAYRLLTVSPGRSPTWPLEAPLVGRGGELATLEQDFARAATEQRCLLGSVVGEPGVGKSRLCAELIARLAGRATVYTGRCLSYGEGITFWPLAQIVRQAAGIHDEHSLDEARERIAALVEPGLADRICALIGLGGDIRADEAPWVIRRLFESLATADPLVALIEDVHWAEPTLLDILERLDGHTQAPVFLLCTSRPELAETRPGWPVTLRLGPLEENEVARLIEPYALAEGARRRVVASARGNPLFAEELAAYLREQPEQREIPATLSALLTARLDLLPEPERAAAERGSVEGEVFHREAVVALSGYAVREELDALVRRELLRPAQATFVGDAAFRFKHVLVRDAAYSGMAKKLRAELHERFANWLESVAGARVTEYEEILGYHLEQAYRYRTELGPADGHAQRLASAAAARLAPAGRRAHFRGDQAAGSGLLARAIALLSPADPQRRELLIDLADSLAPLGELERAHAVAAEALAAARAAGDRVAEARAEVIQAWLPRLRGAPRPSPEEIEATARRAIAVFEEVGSERGLARAWQLLSVVRGERSGSAEAAERAFEYARRVGDGRTEGLSVLVLAFALCKGPTEVERAIARLGELIDRSPRFDFIASWSLALLEAMRGRFEEARGLAEQARARLEELGLRRPFVIYGLTMGEIELLAGDADAAVRYARAALELAREMEDAAHTAWAASFLAVGVLAAGDEEEALELAFLARDQGLADVEVESTWRSVAARVLARRGDLDGERLAREAVELADEASMPVQAADARLALAEVLRLTDRAAEALPLIEEALALYERKGNLVSAQRLRGEIAKLMRDAPGDRRAMDNQITEAAT